jgi:hypothetical protein
MAHACSTSDDKPEERLEQRIPGREMPGMRMPRTPVTPAIPARLPSEFAPAIRGGGGEIAAGYVGNLIENLTPTILEQRIDPIIYLTGCFRYPIPD